MPPFRSSFLNLGRTILALVQGQTVTMLGAFFGLVTAAASCAAAPAASIDGPERFVVYYGQDAAPEQFAPFRLAVLDAEHHPPLPALKQMGLELFGYVSLGEVDTARAHFRDIDRQVLLGSNPNWPDARYVDLRNPVWSAWLLDRIIPEILASGFDGLLLDTLDDAAFLENADPVRNQGMVAAAAALVRSIHRRFPTIKLMLNRAYEVAALVPDQLDSVLAESLASSYDFKSRRYTLRNASDLRWAMDHIAALRALNPRLKLYSLDYWEPTDRRGIERLYRQERQAGMIPYVATVDLHRIVAEPGLKQGSSR